MGINNSKIENTNKISINDSDKDPESPKEKQNGPNDEDFVNYLSNLWNNNNNNNNLRILNELTYNDYTTIDEENFKKFKEIVETNFDSLKIVGNFSYTDQLEKEVRLKKDDLGINDLKDCYLALQDFHNHNEINNTLMNKINKVYIAPKIKDINKDNGNTKNYRFIQIHSKCLKLLDRLWCLQVIDKVKSLDTTIFKSNLIKNMNATIIDTATNNTLSRDNVILIDIEKAFDSCDYEVVEKLLYRSLNKKMDEEEATLLTKQYLYIIKQRILYYKDKTINFKKGIPTGLPSSNIIFSLLMDEIIQEWLLENDELFKIEKDFKLNIFVDDIFMKLYNLSIKEVIFQTLIDKFTQYKFKVNLDKCKADEKLGLKLSKLEETDYYLGIPFTRDLKIYSENILKKYNETVNETNTYINLYLKLIDKKDEYKSITGFFNYKLKPLLGDDDLILFIEKYLI